MATAKGDRQQALARQLERDFLGGSIRLHILHHAQHEEVFGAGLMEELQRHGYRLSPGTLYPTLHGLERGGYLRSRTRVIDGRRRRVYVATAVGKAVIVGCRARLLELVHELFEHGSADARSAASAAAATPPGLSVRAVKFGQSRGVLRHGNRDGRTPSNRRGVVKC